jgi:hypothetical protein
MFPSSLWVKTLVKRCEHSAEGTITWCHVLTKGDQTGQNVIITNFRLGGL